jgi:PAS domain S-box-containing protein
MKQDEWNFPKTEDWFQDIFDLSADSLFIVSSGGQILMANQTACDRLKYSKAELIGKTVIDINAPESVVSAIKALEQLNLLGTFSTELVHLTKDGLRIPTEINSKMATIEGQNVIFTIARDVTERKRGETSLRQSQKRFQVLFENSGTSNSFFDRSCRLVLCNQLCSSLLGFGTPDELVGKSTEDIFGPVQGGVFRDRMNRVMSSGKSETHLSEFNLALGKRFLQTSYNTVVGDEFQAIGVQLISQDITERLHYQEKERRAEQQEIVGILAGGIAHDFNNMLTGLSMNLELVGFALKEKKMEEAAASLARMSPIFERAKHLVKRLLMFSKGGKPVLGIHNLSLHLRGWAEFALSGSDVSLDLKILPGLWLCECDVQQIGQVVDNLVLNARQASPSGGTVSIRAENVMADKPFVRISVTDQGPGVSPETRAKVFDPFFTTKPGGSGLGLATAHSIVQQHNGRIEIETAAKRGATFQVFLPASPHANAVPVANNSRTTYRGSGLALVMDDDDAIREAVARMLGSIGLRVMAVRTGIEALQAFRDSNERGEGIQFMLLDLTIPGSMGGLETLTNLRQWGATATVVAMTGYSDLTEASLKEMGFQGLLAKPFSTEELLRLMNKLLPSPDRE